MENVFPYVIALLTSIISGVISYLASKRQSKEDIEKLVKQQQLNIEMERENHRMELEKIQVEHAQKIDMMQKEFENRIGADMFNTVITEYLKTPEGRQQLMSGANNNYTGRRKRRQ